jgi:hypothetical protein
MGGPAEPVLPVSVSIGGLPSEVVFRGRVPGTAGVLQINTRVPNVEFHPEYPDVPLFQNSRHAGGGTSWRFAKPVRYPPAGVLIEVGAYHGRTPSTRGGALSEK